MITIKVNVYSPRWGHDDQYIIEMSEKAMTIGGPGGKEVQCVKDPYGNRVWKEGVGGYKSLLDIFHNDSIFAPEVFLFALKSAWESWENRELDGEQVEQEIAQLFEWLNTISRTKPETDYWGRIF